MRVVERKEPTPEWPALLTCQGSGGTVSIGCGSVLEVAAEDVTTPGQMDGDVGFFRCPVCKTVTYLDAESTRSAARAQNIGRRMREGG